MKDYVIQIIVDLGFLWLATWFISLGLGWEIRKTGLVLAGAFLFAAAARTKPAPTKNGEKHHG